MANTLKELVEELLKESEIIVDKEIGTVVSVNLRDAEVKLLTVPKILNDANMVLPEKVDLSALEGLGGIGKLKSPQKFTVVKLKKISTVKKVLVSKLEKGISFSDSSKDILVRSSSITFDASEICSIFDLNPVYYNIKKCSSGIAVIFSEQKLSLTNTIVKTNTKMTLVSEFFDEIGYSSLSIDSCSFWEFGGYAGFTLVGPSNNKRSRRRNWIE